MQIESATSDDCRDVAEAHVESWQHAYKGILPDHFLASLSISQREAMWREMLEQRRADLLLARSAGQVAGFVAFGPSRDEDAPSGRAEIWAIYVKPAFWSAGVGHLLWLAAARRIRSQRYETISLWVIAGNERAKRFYEREGFVAEPGSRKQFELGGTTLEEIRYVFTLADQPCAS